jgi:hypothetical protein
MSGAKVRFGASVRRVMASRVTMTASPIQGGKEEEGELGTDGDKRCIARDLDNDEPGATSSQLLKPNASATTLSLAKR